MAERSARSVRRRPTVVVDPAARNSSVSGWRQRRVTRGRPLTDQPHAADIPPGLPSTLLERRPDIGPAEQLLVQSSAAQALLEEARALRLALTAPAVRAPAGLADRIVAAAAKMKSDTAEPRTEGETAES